MTATSHTLPLWRKCARAVLATLLVLAAGMLAWQRWQAAGEAQQLGQQLASATDDALLPLAGRLAALGHDGSIELIAALGSPRDEVIDAATRGLFQQINHYQAADDASAAAQLLLLAQELAERAEGLTPPGRRAAAQLATRIMLHPTAAADQQELLAACQRVLHAAQDVDTFEALPNEIAVRDERRAERTREDNPLRSTAPASPQAAPEYMPPLFPTPPSAAVGKPSQVASPPRLEMPPSSDSIPAGDSGTQPLSHPAADVERTSLQAAQRVLTPLDELDTLSVMRRLHAADPSETSAAERELTRRGFDARHLQLGRLLTHPDAATRRQLAEAVPGLSGVDARSWLLWLSHDDDAQVRRIAVGYLATSNDPRLLARVRELAISDPDPTVQQHAARLSGRQ